MGRSTEQVQPELKHGVSGGHLSCREGVLEVGLPNLARKRNPGRDTNRNSTLG